MKNFYLTKKQFNELLLFIAGWDGFKDTFKVMKKSDFNLADYPFHPDYIFDDKLVEEFNELSKTCKDDEMVAYGFIEATDEEIINYLNRKMDEYQKEHEAEDDHFFQDVEYCELNLLLSIFEQKIKS